MDLIFATPVQELLPGAFGAAFSRSVSACSCCFSSFRSGRAYGISENFMEISLH